MSISGAVIESDPPRRLVLTWARGDDAANPNATSRVTFDIERAFGAVRLTVTHDELEAGSDMHKGISAGWPAVLSSLKTLLETGQSMPMTRQRWKRAD